MIRIGEAAFGARGRSCGYDNAFCHWHLVLLQYPKEAKPDIDIPVAYVSVPYDGISPEDAERLLVKPEQLRSVEGLDVTSVSAEGYGSISLSLPLVRI